jgi:hypothetical protein
VSGRAIRIDGGILSDGSHRLAANGVAHVALDILGAFDACSEVESGRVLMSDLVTVVGSGTRTHNDGHSQTSDPLENGTPALGQVLQLARWRGDPVKAISTAEPELV